MIQKILLQIPTDDGTEWMIGKWVTLQGMTDDALRAAVDTLLQRAKTPHVEKVEIADYEGFYGLTPALDKVLEVARLVKKHGEAYALYAKRKAIHVATEESFQEDYCGVWDSFQAYVTQTFQALYLRDLPPPLERYIDYATLATDLLATQYYTEKSEKAKVHVFRSYYSTRHTKTRPPALSWY